MIQGIRGRRARLIVLIGLAATLQFWGLASQSLWYDEGFSAWLSSAPLTTIIQITADDIQPPFYYLLLGGWSRLAGQSEWALRYLSAFFAVLSIPLLWQCARRLLRHELAADLAALLAALSPLWLWYGREVRMYALLLALLPAALLALERLLRGGSGRGRALLWFGLLATLGVYTHYYFWFVLAGWALAVGLAALRSRRLVGMPLLAFAIPAVAFAPWVSVVLRRLSADRSYWDGSIAPDFVISRALASWMAGHTLLESQALPLGWMGLVLALLGLTVLGRRAGTPRPGGWVMDRRRPERSLPLVNWLLLFFWLVVPVAALLATSWNRPKYHPRYLIFAAPAFLLLVAAFVGWSAGRRWAGRLLAAGLVTALGVVWLVADYNLYRDTRFDKADWRGALGYVAAHREAEEPLLLVSGHAFPMVDYYLSGTTPIRLPDEPTLDTTSILGLDALAGLPATIQQSQSLWLLRWQDEVVDPEGVVPALLQAAGGTVEDALRFKEIDLSHWTLPAAGALAEGLTPAVPVDADFGGALRLVGWSASPTPPPADAGLSIALFWQAQQPLERDFKIHVRVVDEAGFELGVLDQRPTAYNYPTFRWQADETRYARLQIPLDPGTAPGSYWVELWLYDGTDGRALDLLDEAGAPRGRALRLGPVEIGPPAMGWLGAGAPNDATPIEQRLAPGQELLAARLTLPAALEAGQQVPLRLWWRSDGALEGARLVIAWAGAGQEIPTVFLPLDGEGWSGPEWRPGDLLMTPIAVRVPRELAAGQSRLLLWIEQGGERGEVVTVAEGEVVAGSARFDPPTVQVATDVTFGDQFRLVGFDLESLALRPGVEVPVTLHWESLQESRRSYTLFLHLLDGSGQIVVDGGEDTIPLDGQRPTDVWVAGEFVSDTLTIRLPEGAAAGPYRLEVGWYDASTDDFVRLAVTRGGEGDHFLLPVTLEAAR